MQENTPRDAGYWNLSKTVRTISLRDVERHKSATRDDVTGTADELKSKLGGTAVEVVLADEATAAQAGDALDHVGNEAPVVDGTTVRISTTTGLATTAEVVRRLEHSGLPVISLQLRQPSLDEVFLALTGHGDLE